MSLVELESRTLIRRLNVMQSSTTTFNSMVVLVFLHSEFVLFLNLYYCLMFLLSHFHRWQSTSLEVQASFIWTHSSFFTHPYPSFPCSSPSFNFFLYKYPCSFFSSSPSFLCLHELSQQLQFVATLNILDHTLICGLDQARKVGR